MLKKNKKEDKTKAIKGKKVLVVGMGRSGEAAVRALVPMGAKVSVQDTEDEEKVDKDLMKFFKQKKVKCFFGKDPDDVTKYDMVVLSPGVPPEVPFVAQAREAGAEIVGELEIAYRFGYGKYVAITGTNGKTTTTTLVGEIFKNSGRKTDVVGNIGVAVISKAMEADDDTWMITETSSFQLETVKEFKPVISAILNLTPDHMDRHHTMENYGRVKSNIFMNQGKDGYAVINFDDKVCFALAKHSKATIVPFSRIEQLKFGAYVHNDKIVVRDGDGKVTEFCGVDELQIPGDHNLENALAAVAIAFFAGIEPDVITDTLKKFKGVEHRIEPCGEVNGVKFVNDSKGTNPDAAIKAIQAIKGDIIIIAGGYDKGSKYDDFVGAFGSKVKHAVLLGKTAVKIKETAERMGYTHTIIVKDMNDCVNEAFRLAKPGDTVLLSPACASWDMYSSFEERGKDFKACVQKLEK